MSWPLHGTVVCIGAANTGMKVVVGDLYNKDMVHVGMKLYLDDMPDGSEDWERTVTKLLPDEYAVEIDHPYSFDISGYTFTTRARDPPANVAEWTPYDILDFLYYAEQEIAGLTFESMDDMRHLVSSDVVTLTPESSIPDLESAWTEKRRWLESLRTCAANKGITGRATELQMQSTGRFNQIIETHACAYETLFGARFLALTRNGREGAGVAAEFRVNPYWVSMSNGDNAGSASDDVELIEFFLAQASRQNIRKSGEGVVFVEHMVEVLAPIDDRLMPTCAHEGCQRPGMWRDADAHLAYLEVSDFQADDPKNVYCNLHMQVGMMDVHYGVDGKLMPDKAQKREYGSKAWQPCMTPNKRLQTLEDWMNRTLDRMVHYDLWVKFVSNYSSHVKNCGKYLRDTYDTSLPWVVRNHEWFSYSNGVYNIRTAKFVPYDQINDPNLQRMGTANFVDSEFDPAWLQVSVDEMDVDGYDTILSSQQYKKDMVMWLDAFFGRLFFPTNSLDTWEKLIVITGWAATGKSTIAKMLAHIIGEVNVGYIACNCEEQWALANVYDKSVWMCLELKNSFRLPTGVMQSMVSGETVVVNEKHKTAFTLVWELPGLLVGNELPLTWSTDAQNALARRVMPFPFCIAPPTQDSTVAKRLAANLGKLLVRITRRYVALAEQFKDQKIDDHLPDALKDSLEDFKKKSAPISQFFGDASRFSVVPEHEGKMIKWELFVAQKVKNLARKFGISKDDVAKLKLAYDEHFEVKGTKSVPRNDAWGMDNGEVGRGKCYSDTDRPITQHLLDEWCISDRDLKHEFRQWKADNIETMTKVEWKEETYKSACRDMGIFPAANVTGYNQQRPGLMWYGIRKVGGGGPAASSAMPDHLDM
jgi:hypothetical protein